MNKILVLLLCLGLVGCATIQSYNKLEQPEDKVLTASIGSTIFRVNKSRDLPNVFGKADMYGGKVDKGATELKLKGIKENGNLVLQIIDINLASTETTMDRYRAKPVSVDVDTEVVMGDKSAPDQTVFEFDPRKEDFLVISGIRVTFVEVKSYNVMYKLTKEEYLNR